MSTSYIGWYVGDIPTKVPPQMVSLQLGLAWYSRQGVSICKINPNAPGVPQSAIKSWRLMLFSFGLKSTILDPL
jgi:hypothetical protein